MAGVMLMPHALYYHITTYHQGQNAIDVFYRPNLRAVKSTPRYAAWDRCLSIFAIGLFVNSAPEIISGAAFSSGIAAGIVSTIAGQTVIEGAFQIKIKINPFARRLIARCIAIIPALIVTVSVGAEGLSNALTAINCILSIGLIFVTLSVVWYVTHDKYMGVPNDEGTASVSMKLGLVGTVLAGIIWAIVIVTDVATIVWLALGLTS
ncbi:hypothetical protein MMC11_002161 [Xylographa trunciseda]|nr:hypothetical protein [Xylographa trunciseda]